VRTKLTAVLVTFLPVLALSPHTPARASDNDSVVTVECLCVNEDEGWVRGRSMATPTEAGIAAAKSHDMSTILLSAPENRCSKSASGCGDARYTAVTGKRRVRLEDLYYMRDDKDFPLTIDGYAAPAPGEEPLIAVECLCYGAETGWVSALADVAPNKLGITGLTPFQSIIRLQATKNGCAKHANACNPDLYKPITGQVRAAFTGYKYTLTQTSFKLTIEADLPWE
jgi:hypothetical protein